MLGKGSNSEDTPKNCGDVFTVSSKQTPVFSPSIRVCHKKENGHFFLKSKKKNGHGKWGVQRKAHFFDAHFFLFKKIPSKKMGVGEPSETHFFQKWK